MRAARALKTDDARRSAYCSSASPPDNMKTTMAPARYSPKNAAVTIDIPARRSAPISPRKSFTISPTTRGTPPRASTARRGTRGGNGGAPGSHRTAR